MVSLDGHPPSGPIVGSADASVIAGATAPTVTPRRPSDLVKILSIEDTTELSGDSD